jgi:hypothetical protein
MMRHNQLLRHNKLLAMRHNDSRRTRQDDLLPAVNDNFASQPQRSASHNLTPHNLSPISGYGRQRDSRNQDNPRHNHLPFLG